MDQQVIKKSTIAASPELLVAYCQKYFSGGIIQSAYEAGFCGFSLHRFLEKTEFRIMSSIRQVLDLFRNQIFEYDPSV